MLATQEVEPNLQFDEGAFTSVLHGEQAALDGHSQLWEELFEAVSDTSAIPLANGVPVDHSPLPGAGPPIGISPLALIGIAPVPQDRVPGQPPQDPEVDRIMNEIKGAMIALNMSTSVPASAQSAVQGPWVVRPGQITTWPERIAPRPDRPGFGPSLANNIPLVPSAPPKRPIVHLRVSEPSKTPLFLPEDEDSDAPTKPLIRQAVAPAVEMSDVNALQEISDLLGSSSFRNDAQPMDPLGIDHLPGLSGEEFEDFVSALQSYNPKYIEGQTRRPNKKRKSDPGFDRLLKPYIMDESDPQDTLVAASPPSNAIFEQLRESTSRARMSQLAKGRFKVLSSLSGAPRKISEWGLQGVIPTNDADWIPEVGGPKPTSKHSGSHSGSKGPINNGLLPRNPASGIGLKARPIDKGKAAAVPSSTWDPSFSRYQIGESSKAAMDRAAAATRIKHARSSPKASDAGARSRHVPPKGSSSVKKSLRASNISAVSRSRSHLQGAHVERQEGHFDLPHEFKSEESSSRAGRIEQPRTASNDRHTAREEAQRPVDAIKPFSSKPALCIPGSTLNRNRHREPLEPISARRPADLNLNDEDGGLYGHQHGQSSSSRHRRHDRVRESSYHPHGSRRRKVRNHTLGSDGMDQSDIEIVDLAHLD